MSPQSSVDILDHYLGVSVKLRIVVTINSKSNDF